MGTYHGNRPTWAAIDLDSIAHNLHQIQHTVGAEVEITAVVKANAYGHGAVICSKRLAEEGVRRFAVATVDEALELRTAGIDADIVLLGGVYAGGEAEVIEKNLTPIIFSIEQASAIDRAARDLEAVAAVCVKIDTGMGRVGFWHVEAREIAEKLGSMRNIKVDGLMTHFAVADETYEHGFTAEQSRRFAKAVDAFESNGIHARYIDLANSPGALLHPATRRRSVRIGGLLYGIGLDIIPTAEYRIDVQPVMSLRSRVAMLKTVSVGESVGYCRTFVAMRDTVIATVPIGYNDGVPRALGNTGHVLISGKKAPIVGIVSMDWITVDVTEIPGVEVGDLVTIVGADGDLRISVEDIAKAAGTISYEITCGIGPRVPRVAVV